MSPLFRVRPMIRLLAAGAGVAAPTAVTQAA